MSGAQDWQISASVQTCPTAGLWTRTRRVEPVHWVRVSCQAHCAAARQAQAALGRTVASRAWARACSAANRFRAAVSFERGGIRQASVLQVTEAL
ncbi:hypothetical protein K7B06_00695 [Streptomyces erythrochromogenes]|nr:hypothetical protein [Streptomyces erythrochromogenes]